MVMSGLFIGSRSIAALLAAGCYGESPLSQTDAFRRVLTCSIAVEP